MSIEAKAALLGSAAALALLGVTFGLSPFLQSATVAASKVKCPNSAQNSMMPTYKHC